MRARLTALGAAMLGVAMIVASRDRAPREAPAPTDPGRTPAAAARDAAAMTPAGRGGGRPPSLRATRTDGGLVVGADGRFIPTIEARRLFDYFLAASGELPAGELRARIVAEIERRLRGEAAREAVALLDRYLAYREEVRILASGPQTPDPEDLEGRLAALVALRRSMLGAAAADAFFAAEEAHARRTLERRRLASDPTLTGAEREERLAALDAADPPEVREAREAALLAQRLQAAEAELRARGGDPDELQALRERMVGPEAAARLADLDARRRDWEARLAAFREARRRLEEDATRPAAERAAAVRELLDASFTPSERLRVEALERIAAGAG